MPVIITILEKSFYELERPSGDTVLYRAGRANPPREDAESRCVFTRISPSRITPASNKEERQYYQRNLSFNLYSFRRG